MQTTTYGRVRVVLPHVEDNPHPVSSLPATGKLADYRYAGQQVRQLALTDAQLSNGSIRDVTAQRVTLDRVRIESAHIEDCVWSSADLTDCTLSRVVLRHCKILGARFSQNRWANVVFDDCRIEYADLDATRATGPVIFHEHHTQGRDNHRM